MLITPLDHMMLLYEICKYIPNYRGEFIITKTRPMLNTVKFKKLLMETEGCYNIFIHFLNQHNKTKITYYKAMVRISTFKGGFNELDTYIYQGLEPLKKDSKTIKYYPSDYFLNIINNYDFNLYLRKATKKQFGKNDYKSFIKTFKGITQRLFLAKNSGHLKMIKAFGYNWLDELMKIFMNGN